MKMGGKSWLGRDVLCQSGATFLRLSVRLYFSSSLPVKDFFLFGSHSKNITQFPPCLLLAECNENNVESLSQFLHSVSDNLISKEV